MGQHAENQRNVQNRQNAGNRQNGGSQRDGLNHQNIEIQMNARNQQNTGALEKEREPSAEEVRAEKQAIFRLMSQPGMYIKRLRRLQKLGEGSFTSVFDRTDKEYLEAGVFRTEEELRTFRAWHSRERTARLCARFLEAEARGVRMITERDATYPARLRVIEDPPAMLFVRGRLPDDERPSAAIIGARACSQYGESAAAFFASSLSRHGVQIVSGLAAGIDLAAARGSLSEEGSGESFGVLGSGVFVCYPRESYPCFSEMAAGRGGVVSEYPPDAQAVGYHFILRNRIIAGLCDVLLVIEAREKSGTSITVEQALAQGKEIFALPGRITDPLGRGCNALLQDGASVLTAPEDVLDLLARGNNRWKTADGQAENGLFTQSGARRKKSFPAEKDLSALAKSEKLVYSFLDFNAKHIEEVARQSGLGLSGTISALTKLELKGYAVSPQSAYYRKAYQ